MGEKIQIVRCPLCGSAVKGPVGAGVRGTGIRRWQPRCLAKGIFGFRVLTQKADRCYIKSSYPSLLG